MSFFKTKPTELRAVSTNHEEYAEKGRRLLRLAEEVGTRNGSRTSRLRDEESDFIHSYPSELDLQARQEIKLAVQAAEHFRIAGEHFWFESASAYALAAATAMEALKDPTKAAELFTEAAIVMEKVDSNFADEYYRRAISQHCDASQYNAGAMLEERMANNHARKKDFEASIEEYQRASKLYAAGDKHDSADRTKDRAAYFLGKVGRVQDAAFSYQRHATHQARQNTKKFNVPHVSLRAGVLLLSDCLRRSPELDYSEMRKMMEETYLLDCRFEESREHAFLVDLMQCVAHRDLDKFADALFSFDSLSEFDDLMLEALEGIKNAIVDRSNKS
ncbi:hypothetical protein ACHAWF_005863 [Thalassiosira exigua]